MADSLPIVYLFGHSFVKRLFSRAYRRCQSVAQSLGLDDKSQLFGQGQGGLTYTRILSNPSYYLRHIRSWSCFSASAITEPVVSRSLL